MHNYKQSLFASFFTVVLMMTAINFSDNFNVDKAGVIGTKSGNVNSDQSIKSLNNSLADIAQKVNPSVVTIFSKKAVRTEVLNDPFSRFFGFPDPRMNPGNGERIRQGMGSGVIISEDGYIITNNHVVEKSDEVLVRIHGSNKDVEAKIVGSDPKSDVAVLKIEGSDYPAMKLGNSDNVRVGEIVLAVGSPLQESLAHTVTMGIISAKGRSNLNLAEYEDFIQTDAAINPGNSGGALVNIDGELIGINTAIASRSGGNQGIGFSIPINMAKSIMDSILEYGKVVRGYLGVYMQDIDEQMAKALKLKSARGVIIAQVVEGSPADRAGFKTEDIIVELNGIDIENGTQLKNIIATFKPGQKIELTAIRNGKKITLKPVLDELESTSTIASGNKLQEELGFRYLDLTNNLRSEYNIPSSLDETIVVTSVDPRSRAYRAGLREGDAIIGINGKPITDVKSFENLVNAIESGDVIMLKIVRRTASLYFAFER